MNPDVIIIGAGAAGLFCALKTAQAGRKVLILERADKPGLKILISGGGRCNFTNKTVSAKNFLSTNPHFCKSALARFQPEDFIALVEKHGIAYHEKHLGQLFCDHSSKDILNMLLNECRAADVSIRCGVLIDDVEKTPEGYCVKTEDGDYHARRIVVATGGLSYAKLGATDFGYRLAKKFGHKIIPTQPALTPLLWDNSDLQKWIELAGISCPARVSTGKFHVMDDLLFTHQGLSGPAILKISAFWHQGQKVEIDFCPNQDLATILLEAKAAGSKLLFKNELAKHLPARLAEMFSNEKNLKQSMMETPISEIRQFADTVQRYQVRPKARMGYDKAEVTQGGVDTADISSKNMESKLHPGLFFIGEVLDVTGDLGGYNFQWAWASANAAAG